MSAPTEVGVKGFEARPTIMIFSFGALAPDRTRSAV